jgi:hypothetical protein
MAKGGKTELFYTIRVDDQGGFVIDELNTKVRDAEGAFNALEKAILKNTNKTRVSVNELKNLRNELIKNRDSMALTAKEYANYTQQIDKVNTRIHNFQVQAKGVTKVNGDMQSSAGLAGAATIELGRVFSDAGYGIRGVANNIQQLASLFITLSVSAGSSRQALTLIGNQLRGPLGILVLFQGLVALIEYLDREMKIFTSSAKEMEKALEKAAKSTIESTEALRNYLDILDDANTSEEARKNALSEVQKVLPDLFDKQGKLKVSTEELTLAVEDYVKQQTIRAEIDAIIAANADTFAKEAKARNIQAQLDAAKEANDQEKIAEIYEKNATFFQKFLDISSESAKATGGKGLLARLISGDEDVDFVELYRSQTANVIEEANSAREKIQDLMKGLSPDGKSGEGDRDKELTLLEGMYGIVPAEKIMKRARSSAEQARKAFLFTIDNQRVRKLAELVLEEEFAVRKAKLLGASEAELNIIRENFQSERLELNRKFYEKELSESGKAGSKELSQRAKLQKKAAKRLANHLAKQSSDISKDTEKRFKRLRKDIKEASRSIQSVLSDLMSMQRDNARAEIEQVDARANALLSKEGVTASERNNILENAEAEKEKINRKAIKNELKLQQIKFGIMAAELSAKIALDFSEGVISLKKGAAKSASAGFPNNIPLLLAYGAQAASILIGMNQAKKQANSALSSIGGSAASTASTSAADVAPPSFNVVGQSASSQLATALDAMMPETPPIVVMAGDINDAMENYNKAKVESGI